MALLDGKQIKDGSIGAGKLAAGVAGGHPSASNKAMTASVTTSDGDLACATAIANTPLSGGYYVGVSVNGQSQVVGNADKTHDCYFSGDSGTTARAFSAIVSGDQLYWNGSIAGFQLAATDKIDFNYDV